CMGFIAMGSNEKGEASGQVVAVARVAAEYEVVRSHVGRLANFADAIERAGVATMSQQLADDAQEMSFVGWKLLWRHMPGVDKLGEFVGDFAVDGGVEIGLGEGFRFSDGGMGRHLRESRGEPGFQSEAVQLLLAAAPAFAGVIDDVARATI